MTTDVLSQIYPGDTKLLLTGVYKFRVGVKASGITDDHTVNIFLPHER